MTMKRIGWVAVGVLAGCVVIACADDPAPPPGEPFGPGCSDQTCHGDPVGTWTVASGCLINATVGYPDDCPALECKLEVTSVDGTYDLAAAGDGSFQWNTTIVATCLVPKDCVMGMACTDLNTDERSCGDLGSDCRCVGEYTTTGARDGTWRVDELEALVIEDSVGSTSTTSWCVQNNALAVTIEADFDARFGPVGGSISDAFVRLTATP